MLPLDVPSGRPSSIPLGSGKQTSRPVVSARSTRSRYKATDTTQIGPASSPIMPTQSGLTPDKPQVRRSSFQLTAQDVETSFSTDTQDPRAPEETDFEMETPTKKRARRDRSKSSNPNNLAGPSPLRQAVAQETGDANSQGERGWIRPNLETSHTSPEMCDETERTSERPSPKERGASDPITPSKKLSGFQLDGDIEKLIKDGPAKDKQKKMEIGSIYCYKVSTKRGETGMFKIGRTQMHPKQRAKQIKAACGHWAFIEHDKAVARDIPFHGFAEALIHTELSNYQHRWMCVCGTRHKEYYDVSEKTAVEVFERWRDFCKEEPWDSNGKLRPEWRQRLRNRVKFSGTVLELDHDEFGHRWTAFTAPKSFEWLTSDAIRVWNLGFPKRWQIVGLAELFTMLCISRHSFWTTVWAAIVIILLLIDLVITENMHTTTRITQLMGGGLQSLKLGLMRLHGGKVAEAKPTTPESTPEKAL